MSELMDSKFKKQRLVITLRDTNRNTFYVDPGGNGNQCKSGKEDPAMRLGSDEEDNTLAKSPAVLGNMDKNLPVDGGPLQGDRPNGAANNNITTVEGSRGINTTMDINGQAFALNGRNASVRSEIENRLLEEICQSRYTVDPLPGLFARHRRSSGGLRGIRYEKDPTQQPEMSYPEMPFSGMLYDDMVAIQRPVHVVSFAGRPCSVMSSDEMPSVEVPHVEHPVSEVTSPVMSHSEVHMSSLEGPFPEVTCPELTIEISSDKKPYADTPLPEDTTTSPLITKISQCCRRDSACSEDLDVEKTAQEQVGDSPRRRHGHRRKHAPVPPALLEGNPQLSDSGSKVVTKEVRRHRRRRYKKHKSLNSDQEDENPKLRYDECDDIKSVVAEVVGVVRGPPDGWCTDGHYSSCGEETLEEVMKKIKKYNRSMGTFNMEAASGETTAPAEFQGVLRFYHMDGPHAVSKALKLRSTTTVAQLRPLLVDKFGLSRHLEERNETIQSVRLFQRRFDGEVPLEDGDRPLELALTSRCRSRFVVRVPTLEEDDDLTIRMMHTQENPIQDPDLPHEAVLGDPGHARRSKHRHHKRKSKSHRGTDGTVSDTGVDWGDGGFTEGREGGRCECGSNGTGRSSRRPHKCYESDGGMDIASDTGGGRDTSRRGRRRREKRDKEQLQSESEAPRRPQRESSLERLSNQLSLRKGSLRLTRSMNNLVQKTLSLRQRDNPFRRTRPELSTEESAPGVLKIFGGSISPGAEYKSVLATPSSTGRELVKEALERYQISRRQGRHYVLCDVIGSFQYRDFIPYRVSKKGGADPKRPQPEPVWVEECVRIVGDHERPLTIQAFWKPSEDCSRRFELRKRTDIVANVDTTTSGINANARRMLTTKSRLRSYAVTSGDVWPEHLSNADPNMSSSAVGADDESYLSQPEDHGDSSPELPVAHAPGVSGQGTAPASHPYLLTLRGYNEQLDELVHVLREQVTMVGGGGGGQRPPTSTREDIWLAAPDLLPEHCWLSRSMMTDSSSVVGGGGDEQLSTALDPIPGAAVSVNGRQVDSTVTLRAGDVVEVGQYYAFLYKTSSKPADHGGATTTSPLDLTNVRHSMDARPGGGGGAGGVTVSNNDTTNTSVDSGAPPDMLKWTRSRSDPFEVEPGRLRLGYVREKEDELLDRIMGVMDRYPRGPRLTTAYLTSMCVEHSLAKFGPSATRDLISKLSNLIQVTVWEATKLLADKQSSVTSERPTHISDLISELQPLILWLSNAVELHYFFRKNVRETLHTSRTTDPKDDEEAPPEDEMVVILEDVVKYTFQQTVYYLTKALYRHLPAVLERNPFNGADQDAFSSDPLCMGAPTVEGIIVILETTLTSLRDLALHPEIVSQLFCYLFFFTSTNLFNTLMARDAGPKYYKWSKGVQVRGNLDTLEAWAASSGLTQEAVTYLTKINTLTNLLATPRLQLLTANWAGLRRDFPGLNSEQLLKVLTEYELGPGQDQPESWVPPDGAIDPITWSSRLTEGFTDHPPLRLPKGGFMVDLGNPSPEEDLCDVIQRVSAEFGVSDDDGDSGLSVSQTLPVFADIPQSPVYIAEGTTDDPPESSPALYTSTSSLQGTSPQGEVRRELPPYPGLPSQVDCHPASSTAPCKSAPCPVPPKRRSKYDRSHKGPAPAPPRGNLSLECAPASFSDASAGTESRSPPEYDLGDSGISMSASERGGSGRSGSLSCPGGSSSSGTWARADSSPEVGHPRDRKSHCDASQATLPPPCTSGNQRSNTSPRSTRRNRDNSKSPPRYRRSQQGSGSKADTAVTTTTTTTGTGPLAMSSPVSSDSTSPCPSPVVDVLSGIPPQPQKPAPTLDRASIRRSPRAGSGREHGPQLGTGEGDDVNKVVEVAYLQPTTPDGVVNGLRVLPLGEATASTEDSTLKADLRQSLHQYRGEQESSSVDGDLVAGQQQEDEQEDVYIVDLVKGDRGLGLGLIDGLFTPLRRPGIYVRTLVPGEPAEQDGRLQIGDRILAVNGRSVVGADYRSAMNTIRDGGQFLQFLVAQGSRIITMQITASSC